MAFPCKSRINQCAICLLVEVDKLITVNIKFLEDDFVINFPLIRMKDYKIQLFSIQKLGFWRKGVARGSWGARDPRFCKPFLTKAFLIKALAQTLQ